MASPMQAMGTASARWWSSRLESTSSTQDWWRLGDAKTNCVMVTPR